MKDQTETLSVGFPAPPLTLPAANREGRCLLADQISWGTLIVEFLRGTW